MRRLTEEAEAAERDQVSAAVAKAEAEARRAYEVRKQYCITTLLMGCRSQFVAIVSTVLLPNLGGTKGASRASGLAGTASNDVRGIAIVRVSFRWRVTNGMLAALPHAATMATHSIEGLVRQRDAYKELLEQHETAAALHQSAAAAAAPRPETTAAVSPSLNRLQQLQVRP